MTENTFSLGINKFADMNEADFKFRKLNDVSSYTSQGTHMLTQGDIFPVDWRERAIVSPVMNEGSCDSDWAISQASVMETRGFIKTNSTFYTLSVQQLVDCATTAYLN